MKVRVTVKEIKEIERTYEVDGVTTLDNAAKCALRCALHQFQPNTYMSREIPYPSKLVVDSYEVVDF